MVWHLCYVAGAFLILWAISRYVPPGCVAEAREERERQRRAQD